MIDDILIKSVTQIANAKYRKEFPLCGENWFKEPEVRYICEAFYELALKILELSCSLGEHSKEHSRGYKNGFKRGYNDGLAKRITECSEKLQC